MHVNIRVIEVTEFKSEVKFDLGGHHHCRPLIFRAIVLLLKGQTEGSGST